MTTRDITRLSQSTFVDFVALTVQVVQAMAGTLVNAGNARRSRSDTSAVMLTVMGSGHTTDSAGTGSRTRSRVSAHADGFLDLFADRLLGSVRLVLLSSNTVDFFVRRGRGRRVGASSSSVLQAFTGQAARGGSTEARVVCARGGVVRGSGRRLTAADASAECTRDGVRVARTTAVDKVSRGVLERFLCERKGQRQKGGGRRGENVLGQWCCCSHPSGK